MAGSRKNWNFSLSAMLLCMVGIATSLGLLRIAAVLASEALVSGKFDMFFWGGLFLLGACPSSFLGFALNGGKGAIRGGIYGGCGLVVVVFLFLPIVIHGFYR